MYIYISSSWKNRAAVRDMAVRLRQMGHEVYDFTDPACRETLEVPPEAIAQAYDPQKHRYSDYIGRQEALGAAVAENRRAVARADLIVLLLPCGNDAHADWALGVGMGKPSVVAGRPRPGESSPVHLWANAILDAVEDVYGWVAAMALEPPPGGASADRITAR